MSKVAPSEKRLNAALDQIDQMLDQLTYAATKAPTAAKLDTPSETASESDGRIDELEAENSKLRADLAEIQGLRAKEKEQLSGLVAELERLLGKDEQKGA